MAVRRERSNKHIPERDPYSRFNPRQVEIDRLYRIRTAYTEALLESPANSELANSVRVALERQARMVQAVMVLPPEATADEVSKAEYRAIKLTI